MWNVLISLYTKKNFPSSNREAKQKTTMKNDVDYFVFFFGLVALLFCLKYTTIRCVLSLNSTRVRWDFVDKRKKHLKNYVILSFLLLSLNFSFLSNASLISFRIDDVFRLSTGHISSLSLDQQPLYFVCDCSQLVHLNAERTHEPSNY